MYKIKSLYDNNLISETMMERHNDAASSIAGALALAGGLSGSLLAKQSFLTQKLLGKQDMMEPLMKHSKALSGKIMPQRGVIRVCELG